MHPFRFKGNNQEVVTISRIIKANDAALAGREVRLVNSENEQLGVVPVEKAVETAAEAGMDLVAVAEKGDPPVCRIMNFGKHVYEKKRQTRENRKKQGGQKSKELKFHPNIDANDYKIKLNRMLGFLAKGYRVKVSLFFRGREMRNRDQGMDLMKKVIADVGDAGIVDNPPRLIGRNITMLIVSSIQK